ncbi:hypothetical protein CDL15_Pgr023755 [Punica granatum]|uniref:Uncharacterized protein n=1 Tax=Punica granatum TaxID=22663 RepID=A0A218WQV5_PUNGR|nr:hypothetical protein CDL15_Pgr023755 [Punica granatum]PKH73364.1 hypothetical protein CRG98_050054 [Punica granatum]
MCPTSFLSFIIHHLPPSLIPTSFFSSHLSPAPSSTFSPLPSPAPSACPSSRKARIATTASTSTVLTCGSGPDPSAPLYRSPVELVVESPEVKSKLEASMSVSNPDPSCNLFYGVPVR